MVVTMESTMLMQYAFRFPEDTFSTDICPIATEYAVCILNWTPDTKSGRSDIEIWSRLSFDTVS